MPFEKKLNGNKTFEDLHFGNLHSASCLNDIWLHRKLHSYAMKGLSLWIFTITPVSSSLLLNGFLFPILGYDLVFPSERNTFLWGMSKKKNHRNVFWCEEWVRYSISYSSFIGNFLVVFLWFSSHHDLCHSGNLIAGSHGLMLSHAFLFSNFCVLYLCFRNTYIIFVPRFCFVLQLVIFFQLSHF